MINTGNKIQGIVLDISSSSLKSFNDQLLKFRDNDLNTIKSFRIHLTLTMFSFTNDQECINKIIPILEKSAEEMHPITITVGDPLPFGDDYIALEVISNSLFTTHFELVEVLKPYTKEHFNPKYLAHNLNSTEKTYLHEYGYHRIREFYHPHITIGKYSSEEIRDQQLNLAPKITGEFTFDKIYLDTCIDGSGIRSDILWEKELK